MLQSPRSRLAIACRYWLQPKQLRDVYIVALVAIQVANVVGSLYLKVAMNSPSPPHPVTFALYRELMAGVILTTFATGVQGTTMKPAHLPLVAALGLCLFLNQLLFILGLNLAGMTFAACMQPAIPVFTAFLSMLCGQEAASMKRVSGTILAALGAAAMVYGTSLRSPPPTAVSPAYLEVQTPPPVLVHTTMRSLSMATGDDASTHTAPQHHVDDPRAITATDMRAQEIAARLCGDSVSISAGEHCMHVENGHIGAARSRDERKPEGFYEHQSGSVRRRLEAERSSHSGGGGGSFLGALCLVGNCAAMSGYFVLARRLSGEVPAAALTARTNQFARENRFEKLCVDFISGSTQRSSAQSPTAMQGWAYLGAAAWMALVATLTVPRAQLLLPSSSHGPLLYWVFVVSILGYSILTSATSVLVATHVAAFVSVQPLAGAALGWAAFGEQLHAWDAGALFIVLGLFLVTSESNGASAGEPERLSPRAVDRVV